MRIGILRLEAPLLSFGAPAIDSMGVVQRFPALSMLAGLIGNALGWTHADHGLLNELQERLRFAARIDKKGEPLMDYQTVDLGADHMIPEKAGWTTRGLVAKRTGASSLATHQRFRSYHADSIHTLAITLINDGVPGLDEVRSALSEPARPLFIGRKGCVPSDRIWLAEVNAPSLVHALRGVPRARRADAGLLSVTWWEGSESDESDETSNIVAVTDERDWVNQIHGGRRLMREGLLEVSS